jgi:outer membrane protein
MPMKIAPHPFPARPLRGLRPLVLGVALVMLAGGAQAQSLKELFEAARAYDATFLSIRAQAESVVHRAAQSDALRLPGVDLAAGVSRSKADTSRGNLDTNTRQLAINGRQPLFNRPNNATIEQAEKTLDAARADIEFGEQDLIVRLAQAYFDVLGAQDTLSTTQASKKAITEQLASAKRNFEVGTTTITDTREAQARFDLAVAQEIAAENDLRTKRIALDQLVGRPNVTPKSLAVPMALPPLMPAEIDPWVATADAGHPLVRKARLGVDIATLETDKAKAGHLPTVDLTGSLSSTRATGNGATLPGTTNAVSIGVQLNAPLFAGFSIQNRVKETLSLEEKARDDLAVARRSVELGTRQSFLGLQSGQAQVSALEAAEASTKLALEATQLGYTVGVRVNLDVLNAQTQLFTTQRDLASARYNVLLTNLRLRQAAGTLTETDLDTLDRLMTR